MNDILEVGDVMRWDAELVAALMQRENDAVILVKVAAIQRQPDRTVKLWLEHADTLPESKVGS